ncbi:methylated-DNA--[protein]-cysteine S-methyltransferase [Intestinibacter bartlettii]|uniref:Methylated-DNA--protein-cysteine methyltransferase n=1 Tax=Intestinibacter bartlettii TaxID=261299 RepID=A0ABS6DY24_9FIRM|nr:methylated-DNA--[protein]-cysteine S-methyltransferase [Intestinibacter bartlettii]MBU5336449.1 methylated-DNA--[protein]-cysteine S-methyltransferase [Intestinibacter bartlettii]MDO5009634.1 methylated-DNA--[protein]-cysteine S-methyltransferase [Intestinibacter bartlettii]
MDKLFFYDTELGKLGIRDDGQNITHVYFGSENISKDDVVIEESDLTKLAYIQIKEYIDGKRTVFDLPIHPNGTEFQIKVWKALTEIPYGETRSYKDIAISIGNEKACRAVGMANNKNPIPIIIPCHRVVGSNKKLVGYAGGLDLKERLLNLEGISVQQNKVNK